MPSEYEQKVLTQMILDVMEGTATNSDRVRLRSLIDSLRVRGAEAVVLGCTELPLLAEFNYEVEIVDPAEILAQSCARLASG